MSISAKARRRIRVAAVGLALSLTAVTLSAGQAAAAQAESEQASTAGVVFNFNVNGVSTVKKLNSEMTLGPGTLATDLVITPAPDPNDWVATITGNLTLPPSEASFTLFGIVPVTATVSFVSDGPVNGKLQAGVVTATSKVFVKLSNVKVGGIDIGVGNNCQTKTSATINMVSEPGYNLLQGGTLTAPTGYTIPDFDHCGIHDLLLSGLIAGPENQITLTLARAA
jgi:hypothetical protein